MNSTRTDTPLYNITQIRELEQALFKQQDSYAVMQSAARALFDVIRMDFPSPNQQTVHILLGAGNNAGDGLVVAALLQQQGFRVFAYTVFARAFRGDAQKAYDFAVAAGVDIQGFFPFICRGDELIVEAIFGIGLDRPAEGVAQRAIEHINACKAQYPGVCIYVVDVPAGVLTDTGAQVGVAVYADKTVTFIGDKIGLHTADGKGCAGVVIVKDLGASLSKDLIKDLDTDVANKTNKTNTLKTLTTYRYNYAKLAASVHDNRNKSHYGHALIIGGGRGLFGAAALAAVSALKVGAGKSSMYCHHDYATQFHLDNTPLYEVMRQATLQDLSAYSALVLGMGLGREAWGEQVFKATLNAASDAQPLLLDADGLWHLANTTGSLNTDSLCVMTPHEAEAARLLDCSVAQIRCDKSSAVRTLAQRYRCIAVLKGAGTLVSDGKTVWINSTGNIGLATAGTGDVLAGMIGGYLAQGLSALDAALYGVYRHGLAADDFLTQRGDKTLRASELWAHL